MGYQTIVDNIKAIISEKGLKQGYVAKKAGFTDKEMSDMLNENRKLIRAEYLPPLAYALGVSITELFYHNKRG